MDISELLKINAVTAIIYAALIAAAAAFITSIVNTVSLSSSRKRMLYAEAFKAAMGWSELLYRVRRRRVKSKEADQVLTERFHQIQESIQYNQGWLMTENKWLGRSYAGLVEQIKGESEPLIQKAWSEKGRTPVNGTLPDDSHPNHNYAIERFTTDVRLHLSIWPWNKWRLMWRNARFFWRKKSAATRPV